jgi:hypothetical protein
MQHSWASWTTAICAAALLSSCATTSTSGAQSLTLADKSAASLSVKKVGKETFRLSISGEGNPSPSVVNNRLAYEAAKLTEQEKGQWFEAVLPKGSAWTPPPADPTGKRFSFRLENWRPTWTNASVAKKGAPAAAQYKAVIDVVVRHGRFDGVNPLGFGAAPLDDFLKEQVTVSADPTGPAKSG